MRQPWYLKTVYIMGFPVGCVDDSWADESQREHTWLTFTMYAMGWDDAQEYINAFPGQLKTGIMYDTMLNDLKIATNTSPSDLLINSKYFQCLKINTTWGASTTLFKERYEVILREEPHGCMFLLRPSVGYINNVKGLEKGTAFNRWFCENWYDL